MKIIYNYVYFIANDLVYFIVYDLSKLNENYI